VSTIYGMEIYRWVMLLALVLALVVAYLRRWYIRRKAFSAMFGALNGTANLKRSIWPERERIR
jgi:hypothetical protein